MRLIIQPARFLVETLTEASSSRQMAAGFALGMWIGLVPKDNLIAIMLMILLYLIRVNLSAGLMAAFLFSWVGFLLDPLFHQLGKTALTQSQLEPLWTWMINQPFVPWTNFNNTVVMGSFLAGLILLIPVYKMMVPFFEWFTPKCKERLERYKIVRALQGADIATSWGDVS